MAREKKGRKSSRGVAVAAGMALMGLSACGHDKDHSQANPMNPAAASSVSGVQQSGGGGNNVTGQTLMVVAERTRQPVAASVVSRGGVVDITAPGFIPRRQPADQSEAVLWEDDATLPYDVTQNLVYNSGPLFRPVNLDLSLSIDPALLAEPRVGDALNAALDTISRQTPYSVVRAQGPAFIEVAHGNAAGFFVYVTTVGSTVTHARIEVGQPDAYWGPHLQRAITHEIGHVFGLSDCDLNTGMMCSPEPVLDFSANEQEVLRKMTQRTPGNTAPDLDPAGVGSSSRTTRRVCSLPPAD